MFKAHVATDAPTPPARVIISETGELEEVEGSAGRQFVSRHSILRDYARAVMEGDRDLVRFVWVGPEKRWFRIRVDIERGGAEIDRALLTVTVTPPPFGLTMRELDVLTLLASGLGNPDIALMLGVSRRTVTTHVERILLKLGQATRAGAAGMAADLGLLRMPTPGGGRLLPLSLRDAAPSAGGRQRGEPVHRPILIGAPLSLTGFAKADATEMLNGARLAVDEINRRGGVGGRKVELMVVDCDVGDPVAIARAFRKLVDAEVDAIASGYTAAQELAHDIVADYGCLYLNNATLESMVERVRQDRHRFRNIFQVGPSDIHYGPGFVRFLTELEASRRWAPRNRRLAVIQPNWPGMDIGFAVLERLAARSGWSVDLLDDLPMVGIDWRQVTRWINRLKPAAILLAYYFPEESIGFQRAFAADPVDALVYTLYGPSVPAFQQALGPAADGILWATVTGTYADAVGRGFAERYRTAYGVLPGRSHASIAYDRVNMLATAWGRAGNPRAFDRVAHELRSVVHRGVNGAYHLDNPGQVSLAYPDVTLDPSIGQAHLVFQIQGGRHSILSPAPYVDGVFRTPPWFGRR